MHTIKTAFENGRGQRLAAMLDWPADDRPIAGLERALLVMHSPVDRVVGIDNASAIFRAAKHPKSFVSLDRADHLLGDSDDSRYAARMIATWAKRYLPRTREGVRLPGFEDNRVAKVPTED